MGTKWSDIADTQLTNDTDELLVIQNGENRRIKKLDFLQNIISINALQNSEVTDIQERLGITEEGLDLTGEGLAQLIQTVADLQNSVNILEDGLFFEYSEVQDLTVTEVEPNFQTVNSLQIQGLRVGLYKVDLSMFYKYTSTSNSIFTRYRLNGGEWVVMEKESKDSTDKATIDYSFIYNNTAVSDFTLEVEGAKESNTGTYTIYNHAIMIDKKE